VSWGWITWPIRPTKKSRLPSPFLFTCSASVLAVIGRPRPEKQSIFRHACCQQTFGSNARISVTVLSCCSNNLFNDCSNQQHGHPRIVFLSPRLLKELECYVRSVKQREVDWSFLPLRKNHAGDSHPTRWPSISINSSEVRALMAHPASAEDDHLQLH